MTERIRRLRETIPLRTEDMDCIATIEAQFPTKDPNQYEAERKAQMLQVFAREMPVVLRKDERICGSAKFGRTAKCKRNVGHIAVDYPMILRDGLSVMRSRAQKHGTTDGDAMATAADALIVFIKRYADAAAQIPSMKQVAENCRVIAERPPETFWQALQLIWFVHLFLHAEGGQAGAFSFGRFDKNLYPFYQRDTERGILTEDEAKELLACFWIKTCETDESQNLTVGGDEENDLTFLCLDVTRELCLPQPSLSVRFCEQSSERLWDNAMELVRAKIGMPAMFWDDTLIRALQNRGVTEADAKNYAIVGCYEANADSATFGTTAAAGVLNLHEILLDFLKQPEEYLDFPSFYEAFRTYFTNKYNTDVLACFRRNWAHIRKNCVSPFESVCFDGCLQSGRMAEHGGCKYTMAGINVLGIGTLTDSLYVMKKLVFEQKRYSYADFVSQVFQNFPDPVTAELCRNMEGKYGTDNPETNELAHELSLLVADCVDNGIIEDGVVAYAGLFQFLADVFSENVPATPDGRRAGERLSYGIAASDLCKGVTVTSLLNSATHIANDRFADGNPLMFRIGEREIAGDTGKETLKNLLKTYFEKGGFHVQINVADRETLKDAQIHPERYRDLLVRISGFSTYFTTRERSVQDALIERT